MRTLRAAIAALSCAAACGFAAAAGPASDAPDEALRPRVAAAVRQLGSDSFRARQEAERQLLDWGTPVLPLLPGPAELDDASAREAVRRIRVQLEHRQARESLRASRVKLSGTLPLAAILEAIERQSGNPLDRTQISPERLKQELPIEFDGTPFWKALADVAEPMELRIEPAPQGRAVRLIEAADAKSSPPAAVAIDGPFRIAAELATVRPLFGDASRRLVRIRLSVLAEPRVRPLFLALAAKDVQARSSSGGALIPFAPEAKYELPLADGGAELSFALDFTVPAEVRPESLAANGRMTVQAAAGREAIRFPVLSEASGVSRRRGGATVAVGKIALGAREGGAFGVTVPVTVGYDAGGPAFESHRQWVYHNEVYLETKDGGRVPLEAPFRTARQADGGAALEYAFRGLAGDPADYRFVYVLPTLIVDVPVEFEFPRVPVAGPDEEEEE
ncbi:MAG: hypothetical protein WED34_10800 [Planctomycetales bacterium]